MTTGTGDATEVEPAIGGMTCASGAARIEKKLNRIEGVEATVNFATEKAKVTVHGDVAVADLIETVEKRRLYRRPSRTLSRRDAGH